MLWINTLAAFVIVSILTAPCSGEVVAKRATLIKIDSAKLEQAEALLMQGDRLGALEVLKKVRSQNLANSGTAKEAKDKIESLYKVFVTEKGQQLFQKAESLHYSGVRNAIDDYKAALKAEPNHPLVLTGLVSAQLAYGLCSDAKQTIAQLEPFFSIDTDMNIELVARAELCLKDFEKAKLTIAQVTNKNSLSAQTVIASVLYSLQDWPELLAISNKMIQQYPGFQEAYFWSYSAKKGLGLLFESELASYVDRCKKVDFIQRKAYGFFPGLCGNVTALERSEN